MAITGICAALYAAVGYLTFLGIFSPVGIVKFWPAVIIPGVFAVLFGPWVGAVGASIGIFASDLITGGNPLLSLTVGVPANFVDFFLIGYLSRRKFTSKGLAFGIAAGALSLVLGFYSITYFPQTQSFTGLSSFNSGLLFLAAVGTSYILIIIVSLVRPEWKSYSIGSVVGQAIGSAIVGLGVWGFTQFILVSGISKPPFYFALLEFVWTFATEIPFLLLLGPPILKACYKSFPSLSRFQKTKER